MKTYILPIFTALCCMTSHVVMANVATTAGSNLTAWNGGSGATNNNAWNTSMNNRTMATGPLGGSNAAPVADFGNCNALILRCAKPKCSGCTTLELAEPIVAGCVNSNTECKKHGEDLIDFISAQLVADANAAATAAAAKAQAEASAQSAAAANAAATAAANANNAQINELQSQLSQMVAAQAESNRQIQQLTQTLENNAAQPAPASTPSAPDNESASVSSAMSDMGLAEVERIAKENDVDTNLLARKVATGEIMSKIEDAQKSLTSLKAAMEETFRYAGCNSQGANCTGPKRVKKFKELAYKYFEPYDAVADHMYYALETALMVGVDVNDVIMMLSGSCERWGRYICRVNSVNIGENGDDKIIYPVYTYTAFSCEDGMSKAGPAKTSYIDGNDKEQIGQLNIVRGGQPCTVHAAVPPEDDTRCTLSGILMAEDEREVLLREWDIENQENEAYVRIGCATNALNGLMALKRGSGSSKKAMDIDVLERMLTQDASDLAGRRSSGSAGVRSYGGGSGNSDIDRYKYCALTVDGYNKLQTALAHRRMPTDEICVSYKDLGRHALEDLVDFVATVESENYYEHSDLTCGIGECDETQWNDMKRVCESFTCEYTDSSSGNCTVKWDGDFDGDTEDDNAKNTEKGICKIEKAKECVLKRTETKFKCEYNG